MFLATGAAAAAAAAAAAGDLFTALLLARMHSHPGDLKTALEQAVAGLQVRARAGGGRGAGNPMLHIMEAGFSACRHD